MSTNITIQIDGKLNDQEKDALSSGKNEYTQSIQILGRHYFLSSVVEHRGFIEAKSITHLTLEEMQINGIPVDPDEDDWIPWVGGHMPLPYGENIRVRHRDGAVYDTIAGGTVAMSWWHHGLPGDIIAYKILNAESWKIRHVKPKNYTQGKHSACTILYRKIDDKHYEYKFSICHHKDMFSRKIGRTIAENRKAISFSIEPSLGIFPSDSHIIDHLLNVISNNVKAGWQFRYLVKQFGEDLIRMGIE